jgi:rSAM/selenodomain-associated transferase 1
MNMHIVVMAKAPEPGRVKTRLAQAIGEDAAAALAGRMLQRTLETARRAAVGTLELCVTPDLPHPSLCVAAARFGACLSEQGDGDLGQRMARIARRVLADGEQPIIVGSDCPELAPHHLQRATHMLLTRDAVLQPAADGGYVLIGLRAFDPRLFDALPWGTATVMAITRDRLRELAWSWWQGETLHDIDTAADLVHLPEEWKQT